MSDLISRIQELHFDDPFNKGYCAECSAQWPCDAIRAVGEIEALEARFTGELDQPPLEKIRAKCEQYWNEHVMLCPEEMHAILEFIHKLAWNAGDEAVELRTRVAKLEADREHGWGDALSAVRRWSNTPAGLGGDAGRALGQEITRLRRSGCARGNPDETLRDGEPAARTSGERKDG